MKVLEIKVFAGGGELCHNRSDKKFTFFEKAPKISVCEEIKKARKAFSVAEAMITLLIVSVALAAMAPIMTKKARNDASGNSKWVYTKNGTDITRVGGKVGIGLAVNENPSAKLHVKGGHTLIEGTGTDAVFVVNVDGANFPVRIEDKKAKKMVYVDFQYNNPVVYMKDGVVTSFMSMDGNVYKRNKGVDEEKTVQQGMVSFFRLPNCPNGWRNVNDPSIGWGGLYFRVADANNVYGSYQADQNKVHNHQYGFRYATFGYRDGGEVGLGRGDSKANIEGWGIATANEGSSEARPQTVPLTACEKL